MRDEHVIVVDLGFGDAGKGTIVDWLCRNGERSAVIRFNGGAQAAHNVVTDDGRHHTFAQFGAGSFVPSVPTHLAHTVLVDPFALVGEAAHLASVGVGDVFDRLTVDERALLTTPWHRAANQARELARGTARHGSCGMGIGETARYALAHPDDAPTVGDCRRPQVLRRKLRALAARVGTTDWDGPTAEPTDPKPTPVDVPNVDDVMEVLALFADATRIVDGGHIGGLLDRGPVVFEGAQGVLLDEWAGFHPYTTWSTTTTANALSILAEHGHRALRLGVLRTYTTRHGAGPLPTEDATLAASLPEPHNGTGLWQGAFRVGHFDAVAHRYALDATGGVDALAVTHLDVVTGNAALDAPRLGICDEYRAPNGAVWTPTPPESHDLDRQARLTETLSAVTPVLHDAPSSTDAWLAEVSGRLDTPIAVTSHGPTASAKRGTAAAFRR